MSTPSSPTAGTLGTNAPWHTPLGGLLEAQRIAQQAHRDVEHAKTIHEHVPGNPYDVALAALNSTLAELSTLITQAPASPPPAAGPNGWPIADDPGTPANDEVDGWHWAEALPGKARPGREGPWPIHWVAGYAAWNGCYGAGYAAEHWRYLGPCPQPRTWAVGPAYGSPTPPMTDREWRWLMVGIIGPAALDRERFPGPFASAVTAPADIFGGESPSAGTNVGRYTVHKGANSHLFDLRIMLDGEDGEAVAFADEPLAFRIAELLNGSEAAASAPAGEAP